MKHNVFSKWFTLATVALAALASTSQVLADVPDLTKKKEEKFFDSKLKKTISITFYGDDSDETKWYYVPVTPRLDVEVVNGTEVPKFMLMEYSFRDPENPEGLLKGAVCQLEARIDLPPDTFAKAKAYLAKELNVAETEIELSAVPMRKARVAFYNPAANLIGRGRGKGRGASDTKEAVNPQPGGNAPTIVTNSLPFSCSIDSLEANLLRAIGLGDALQQKSADLPKPKDTSTPGAPGWTGGIRCIYTFDYDVQLPPLGFKLTVDWDKAYTYFDENKKIREKFKRDYNRKVLWGLFSYKSSEETTVVKTERELRQTLETSGVITIEMKSGEKVPPDVLQAYMKPIVDEIAQEVLGAGTDPPDMKDILADDDMTNDDAELQESDGGYKLDFNIKRKGKVTYNFSDTPRVAMPGVADGFISLASYPKEIRAAAMYVAPYRADSAIYTLPAFYTDDGIRTADIDMQLFDSNSKDLLGTNESVRWFGSKTTGKWQSAISGSEKARSMIVFPLLEYRDRLADLRCKTDFKVVFSKKDNIQRIDSINATEMLPLKVGSASLSDPLEQYFTTVKVVPKSLRFIKRDDEGDPLNTGLDEVEVKFIQKFVDGAGNKRSRTHIQSITASGESVYFLAHRNGENGDVDPYEVTITYIFDSNKDEADIDDIVSKHSGENLTKESFRLRKEWKIDDEGNVVSRN